MKRKKVKPSRATRTLPGTSFSFPSSSFSCILETFPTWAKIFSKPRCHVLCCPPEKGINLWKYFFCLRRPLDGEKFLPLVHSAVLASSLGGSDSGIVTFLVARSSLVDLYTMWRWHFWWAGLAHPGQHDRGVMAHTLDPRPFQLAIAQQFRLALPCPPQSQAHCSFNFELH